MSTGKIAIRVVLFAISILLAGCELNAKDSAETALEESNLKKALYCMEILENRPDLEPKHRIDILRNECYSEHFIEHSPNIPDGRDALLSLFESRYKKYPKLSMSIKRTASDGDLVWLHLHVKHTPESLGGAAIQIFRMEEGKIVEHWGVGQSVPKKSKNINTMF
ncbi:MULTISPECIES: nuclear transport factor 2 family protein [unclassified Pseudoalteromonas]|uniref:nuclear transport factor 2 family protein n=1 Tax=Pseudoalteromonas TaxID=53246 RepID=UPI0015D5635F|nr:MULTISPECIES: nuclear transport factor 2 family protein [unclassified Pseudoalteromonas]MCC9659735.1 nuclear transport factor 2 family protein [Pseudoalteromonas sp. MB41]QLJ09793.1 nuclear transport factor 2 family protein [Pseudoalteromonas sp. JSTW]